MHDAVLEPLVAPQHQPEDTDEGQQQREHREESVVRDEGRQVAGLVITELLEHREGERQPASSLLEVVDLAKRRLNVHVRHESVPRARRAEAPDRPSSSRAGEAPFVAPR